MIFISFLRLRAASFSSALWLVGTQSAMLDLRLGRWCNNSAQFLRGAVPSFSAVCSEVSEGRNLADKVGAAGGGQTLRINREDK